MSQVDSEIMINAIPNAPLDSHEKARRVILAHDPDGADIIEMLGLTE